MRGKQRTATRKPHRDFLALLIPLSIYWAIVPGASYARREVITPDNVCYIRNAQYLVEGRFLDSVSACWSPLISWCMAPLISFGVDGLYAARIVLAIWGCGLVIACYFFMRSLTRCALWKRISALSLVAIAAVRSATYMISPDLMLFALLIVYCAVILSPNFLRDRRLQVFCGVLGGIAFLAKSYAFPFFLAHFTCSVGLHWLVRRKLVPFKKIVPTWVTGVLAFAVVAGPWVGLLSWKYQTPTLTTAGPLNHAIIGPEDKPREHPYNQLFRIAPDRYDIWETPEALPYNLWSPFESRAYFVHQVKHALRSLKLRIDSIGAYDVFRVSLPALVFLPIVAVGLGSRRRKFKAIWTIGTVLVYLSGFVMVHNETRYFEFFLWPICCIYCIGFGLDCFGTIARRLRMPSWCLIAVSLLVVASFAESSRERNWKYLCTETVRDLPYRKNAMELEEAGCEGPIAVANGSMRAIGMFTAYHMDAPYAGCLSEEAEKLSVPQKEARLKEFGVKTLIVSPKATWWKEFQEQTSWKVKLRVPDRDNLIVYVSPDESE